MELCDPEDISNRGRPPYLSEEDAQREAQDEAEHLHLHKGRDASAPRSSEDTALLAKGQTIPRPFCRLLSQPQRRLGRWVALEPQ